MCKPDSMLKFHTDTVPLAEDTIHVLQSYESEQSRIDDVRDISICCESL